MIASDECGNTTSAPQSSSIKKNVGRWHILSKVLDPPTEQAEATETEKGHLKSMLRNEDILERITRYWPKRSE